LIGKNFIINHDRYKYQTENLKDHDNKFGGKRIEHCSSIFLVNITPNHHSRRQNHITQHTDLGKCNLVYSNRLDGYVVIKLRFVIYD